MKALITGIAGQDGSYLSELLLDEGLEVHGIIRRNSTPEHQESRIHHLGKAVNTYYGDITDLGSVYSIIKLVKPDLIFNLAAQSHVRISFDIPKYTMEVNTLGALNIFQAVRDLDLDTRIYQASSSEMFGTSIDSDGYQRESTKMNPVSPYGIAKLAAYGLAKSFRESYGMYVCNGILFNHESPRRGSNFVTTKIIKGALDIKHGRQNELILGNVHSIRDWGHSKDYVKAMYKIMCNEKPEDFVVATGYSHSVAELCDIVFSKLGMDWKTHVSFDPRLLRPNEVPELRGDSNKIRSALGWKPTISFQELVDEMLSYWSSQNSDR